MIGVNLDQRAHGVDDVCLVRRRQLVRLGEIVEGVAETACLVIVQAERVDKVRVDLALTLVAVAPLRYSSLNATAGDVSR